MPHKVFDSAYRAARRLGRSVPSIQKYEALKARSKTRSRNPKAWFAGYKAGRESVK